MRLIGTLSAEQHVRRFAAYLTTQGLSIHAEQEPGGWAIWVRDENDVDRAREWYEQFQSNPDDPKYAGAEQAADALIREQVRRYHQARRNVIQARQLWQSPLTRVTRLVSAMIVLSCGATLFSSFGKAGDGTLGSTVTEQLTFCSPADLVAQKGNPLASIARGQVWRLVTPIFLHLGILHLVFDMYWLWTLGSQVERLRGTVRLAGLVLVVAVCSNVAQAVIPPPYGGPRFGGMSGVVYGLFGFIWMRSVFVPGSRFYINSSLVIFLLVWLFVCMTGFFGPIANVAHVVGLITGMVAGYLPAFISRR